MVTGKVGSRAFIVGSTTVSLFLLLSSCNKGGIVDPGSSFSGITRTDSTGMVLSSDPGDWEPIPAVGMEFHPQGAYPNPCKAGTGFNLAWHLTQTDSIFITMNDSPAHVLDTLGTWLQAAGNYLVHFPMTGYQPGIYRVYFKVVRPDSTYVTHGDVQVSD